MILKEKMFLNMYQIVSKFIIVELSVEFHVRLFKR